MTYNNLEKGGLQLSESQREMYRVASSSVCQGRGVFATEPIPQGTVITPYSGALYRFPHPFLRISPSPYLYIYADERWVIDGDEEPSEKWMCGGHAQLANDAVHPDVTRKTNNCVLRELHSNEQNEEPDICNMHACLYLVAARDVEQGEELLVAYGLEYWLSDSCCSRPPIPCGSFWRYALENSAKDRGNVALAWPLFTWLQIHEHNTDLLKTKAQLKATRLLSHRTWVSPRSAYAHLYGTPFLVTVSRYRADPAHPAHTLCTNTDTVTVTRAKGMAVLFGCRCQGDVQSHCNPLEVEVHSEYTYFCDDLVNPQESRLTVRNQLRCASCGSRLCST